MAILTREKLAAYGTEVLVVVFGILIAFQVEEWREERQRGRELDAVLIRLAEETATNLSFCERVLPIHADDARRTLTVVKALNAGRLDEADRDAFEAGLIRAGYNPGAPYSVTVAEEMIATGLLKDLGNSHLRNRVAELPLWIDGARDWATDTRGSLKAVIGEVAKAVDFEYEGDVRAFDEAIERSIDFEDDITVAYALDDLLANRTLKNVFIEAADTHLDMWRHNQDLCRKFEEIQASLTEAGDS